MNLVCMASGFGSNFNAIIKALKPYDYKITLITDKTCNAINIAKQNNIKYYCVPSNDFQNNIDFFNKILELLKTINPEYILLAGFMKIIPDFIVRQYPLRIINIHPSLLPSYKGKDAIKRAWLDRVKVSGVSVHYVNCGVDIGPMIMQKCVKVKASLNDFENDIHKIEHEIYTKTLIDILNKPFNKLFISKCLLGVKCRYNAKDKYDIACDNYVKNFNGKVYKICPEIQIGLKTPREPFDYINGSFFDKNFNNLDNDYKSKFNEYYNNLSKNFNNNDKILFILKENSPSCGVKKIGYITEKLRLENNIYIVSEKDISC